ncbi:iron-containing redox enzyme family protein [Nannocystis bainbridge]|uniref:Iron-containing redox enzyme family protein n=1 Tax=Nannocystis bainbridge TaxID=2995303 RepID=A0ABT5EFV1_9BACT|nr:iron-containing redox enzyme family protein [Nannocystis bainbridge]MDC0723721.1 iron-containing redox enzyme family protein [Nannocystis bainbridge]
MIAILAANVRAALGDRSPKITADAAQALARLADRAFAGDDYAAGVYHGLVWDLHADPDPRTYAVRRYLVETGYAVEEAHVPRLPEAPLLAPDALLARLQAEQNQRTGLRHPMSEHLFHGRPSLADLKIYLRHHWHRSRLFYRELTELALSCPLGHASVLHRNLYDETGGEHGAQAHPVLLQRLLRHFDLPHGFDDRPALPEAHAYLNNRIRCARHPNLAWGLAVLFSLEAGTPATHGNIHALLQRFDVPEHAREFHRVHMSADVEHARETAELIGAVIQSPADQAILFASLRYHRALGQRYFDAIWREMQATHDDRDR